jgi:hypothetical protein
MKSNPSPDVIPDNFYYAGSINLMKFFRQFLQEIVKTFHVYNFFSIKVSLIMCNEVFKISEKINSFIPQAFSIISNSKSFSLSGIY